MQGVKPILLIEDNPRIRAVIKQALDEMEVIRPLVCFEADVGYSYLDRVEREEPCLILLNPGALSSGGLEFLAQVKSIESLRTIPIVVLADGNCSEDTSAYYGAGSVGYIVAADDHAVLIDQIKTLVKYWSLSQLPENIKLCTVEEDSLPCLV